MTSFIFSNFLDLKQLKNYQIYIHTNKIRIQMIEFKFKWTNQKVTPHYHPGGSARLDSNVDVTARSVPPQPGQAVAPGALAVAPPGRVLPPATGTNLTCQCKMMHMALHYAK
jgi:hypothetical protein